MGSGLSQVRYNRLQKPRGCTSVTVDFNSLRKVLVLLVLPSEKCRWLFFYTLVYSSTS